MGDTTLWVSLVSVMVLNVQKHVFFQGMENLMCLFALIMEDFV